jgi:hypothetical protein
MMAGFLPLFKLEMPENGPLGKITGRGLASGWKTPRKSWKPYILLESSELRLEKLLANATRWAHLGGMSKKGKRSVFLREIASLQRDHASRTKPLKGVSRITAPTKPPKVG